MENIPKTPSVEENEELSEEESQRRVIEALTEGLRPGEHPYCLRRALEHFEEKHLRKVLELTGHDQRQAAKLLDITPRLLASKMKKHKLS
jgi:transcriptional regulator with GAF, ATPase, and Fis domain